MTGCPSTTWPFCRTPRARHLSEVHEQPPTPRPLRTGWGKRPHGVCIPIPCALSCHRRPSDLSSVRLERFTVREIDGRLPYLSDSGSPPAEPGGYLCYLRRQVLQCRQLDGLAWLHADGARCRIRHGSITSRAQAIPRQRRPPPRGATVTCALISRIPPTYVFCVGVTKKEKKSGFAFDSVPRQRYDLAK